MAGEIFIARQDTLEEVKQTVNEIDTNVDTVNNTTSETKTQTTGIKADTDGLKLSTDSIKQIADTILERIGLTTDVGGANTGTVNGKLNALFSSGGGGIKRVQRGIVTIKECDARDPAFNNRYYIFLNLQKPINPEKSFLLIQNFNPAIPADANYQFHCVGRIYSSTQLVLYGNYKDRNGMMHVNGVLWEVVEFN